MPVGIYSDLDRAVTHLLLDVGERRSVLNQQGAEGVAQIMQPEPSQTGMLTPEQQEFEPGTTRSLSNAFRSAFKRTRSDSTIPSDAAPLLS